MGLGLQPWGRGLDSPSASLSVCPTGGAHLWPPEGSELREAVTIHQPQCVPRSLAALHLFWNVPSSSLAPSPSGQRGVATWVSGCCEASVGPRGGERDRGQQWEGRARAPGHSGTLQASSWPPRASRAVENRGSAWHTLVTEQRPCASLQCIS